MCPPSSDRSEEFEDLGIAASAGGGAAASAGGGDDADDDFEVVDLGSVVIDGASYTVQQRLEGRGQPGFAAFVKHESGQERGQEFLVKEDDLGTCFAEATADIIPETMLPDIWRSVVNYASIAIKDNTVVTIQQKVTAGTSGNTIKGLDEVIFGRKRDPKTWFSDEWWNNGNWLTFFNNNQGSIKTNLSSLSLEVKWQIAAALYASSLAGDESLHFGQFMAEVDGQGKVIRIVRVDFGARERYSHIRNSSRDNDPVCTSEYYAASGQFFKKYITYFLQDEDIKSKYLALWYREPDFNGIKKKISDRVTASLEKMSREQQKNTITNFLEIIDRKSNPQNFLRIKNMDKDFDSLTEQQLQTIHNQIIKMMSDVVCERVAQMHAKSKEMVCKEDDRKELSDILNTVNPSHDSVSPFVDGTEQVHQSERVGISRENEQLIERNIELQKELSAALLALETAQTQNTETQQRLAEEIAKNSRIERQNAELQNQNSGLYAQVSQIQRSLDEEIAKNSRIESQNAELQNQNSGLHDQLSQIQRSLDEEIAKNSRIESQNAELQNQNSGLHDQLSQIQRRLDAAMEKNNRIESQNAELQKEIDKLRKDSVFVNKEKDNRIAQLERQLSEALSKASKAGDKEDQATNKTEDQSKESSQNNTAKDRPDEPSQANDAYTNQLGYNLESNNNVNPVDVNIPEIQPQPVGLVSSVFEKINRFIKAVLQGIKDTVHSVARALKIR